MKILPRWLTVGCLVAQVFLSSASRANDTNDIVQIPLYIFNLGDLTNKEFKVGIRLKIDAVHGGGEPVWRMYEFDTGGTGFLAFPYSASGNTTGDYTLNYASGNMLSGNATNTKITFENMQGQDGADITTDIVVITEASNTSKPNNPINSWTTLLPHHAPLETYFYGDFGMSLSTLAAPTASDPTIYSVLPQLLGPQNTGFMIDLGFRPTDDQLQNPGQYGEVGMGFIQVGLTAAQQEAGNWASTVPMVAPENGEFFPNSGQPVYTEILSQGTMIMTDVGTYDVGIVYDTGAPNVTIHPVGDDSALLPTIQDALNSGETLNFSLTGMPYETHPNSTILNFSVANESAVNEINLSTMNVVHSPGLYVNTGITAFFGHQVVFNLADGFVGLNPIPEPSTAALLGLGAVAMWWRRRRRD
jgi:hypothetical protein